MSIYNSQVNSDVRTLDLDVDSYKAQLDTKHTKISQATISFTINVQT
jgi:hypothetical protein